LKESELQVFAADGAIHADFDVFFDGSTRIVIWRPGFFRFIPPGKGFRYIVYWLFHMARIFRNRDYCSIHVYNRFNLAFSMLIVPAHFKWPFMGGKDLQFTYVITNPLFRRKGIAEKSIRFLIQKMGCDGRTFWYVANQNNLASIKLCSKLGFRLVNRASKKAVLGILRLSNG
jgi:ribosomal protein S18 acetylase RimI-like enzyme